MKLALFILLIPFTFALITCKKDNTGSLVLNPCSQNALHEIVDTCLIAIPNAFSPNGDGLNDFMGVMFSCTIEGYSLVVKNSEEIIVFQATDPFQMWDGTFGGQITEGDYDYTVSGNIEGAPFAFTGGISIILGLSNGIDCSNCLFQSQYTIVEFDSNINSGEQFCY